MNVNQYQTIFQSASSRYADPPVSDALKSHPFEVKPPKTTLSDYEPIEIRDPNLKPLPPKPRKLSFSSKRIMTSRKRSHPISVETDMTTRGYVASYRKKPGRATKICFMLVATLILAGVVIGIYIFYQ